MLTLSSYRGHFLLDKRRPGSIISHSCKTLIQLATFSYVSHRHSTIYLINLQAFDNKRLFGLKNCKNDKLTNF